MLRITCLLVLTGSALAAAAPASAVEPVRERGLAEAVESNAGDTISNAELSGLRGGQGVVLSNQTLVAITSGNVINGDYAAGNVSLSDNALSNFNGLGNVLINTGAQVSLQTGMSVTINVGE